MILDLLSQAIIRVKLRVGVDKGSAVGLFEGFVGFVSNPHALDTSGRLLEGGVVCIILVKVVHGHRKLLRIRGHAHAGLQSEDLGRLHMLLTFGKLAQHLVSARTLARLCVSIIHVFTTTARQQNELFSLDLDLLENLFVLEGFRLDVFFAKTFSDFAFDGNLLLPFLAHKLLLH